MRCLPAPSRCCGWDRECGALALGVGSLPALHTTAVGRGFTISILPAQVAKPGSEPGYSQDPIPGREGFHPTSAGWAWWQIQIGLKRQLRAQLVEGPSVGMKGGVVTTAAWAPPWAGGPGEAWPSPGLTRAIQPRLSLGWCLPVQPTCHRWGLGPPVSLLENCSLAFPALRQSGRTQRCPSIQAACPEGAAEPAAGPHSPPRPLAGSTFMPQRLQGSLG